MSPAPWCTGERDVPSIPDGSPGCTDSPDRCIRRHPVDPDLFSHLSPHSDGREAGTRRRQARASLGTRAPPTVPATVLPGPPPDAGRPDGARQSRWSQGELMLSGPIPTPRSPPAATPPCHPERNARRAWSRRISGARDRLSGTQEILRLRGCAPALRMTGESWLQESDAGGRRSGRCDRMSRCCRGVGPPPDPGVERTNAVMPWAWPPHRGGPACRERCG